jgi:hypothetical protein
MREKLFNTLKSLYPTYWVGQYNGKAKEPYVVIKFNNQSTSNATTAAGWQMFEVMVYVPIQSILPMEKMIDTIINALINDYEFTGNITPDFVDTDKEAWMRSIQFRIPKEIKRGYRTWQTYYME